MLEKVGNWNFDIFLFDRLTNGEFASAVPLGFVSQHADLLLSPCRVGLLGSPPPPQLSLGSTC